MLRTAVGLLALSCFGLLCAPAVSSGATLREGIEDLARELLLRLPAGARATVAVGDFADLSGVTSDLGRFLAERLTTLLSHSDKVATVERLRLNHVLAQLRLTQEDLTDPQKASQIQKVMGLDGVVTGTLLDAGPSVEVEARLVAVGTGRIIVATSVTISKDPAVERLMASGRPAPPPPAVVALPPAPSPPQRPPALEELIQDDPEARRFTKAEKVFQRDYERVWNAVIAQLEEHGGDVVSSDHDEGYIVTNLKERRKLLAHFKVKYFVVLERLSPSSTRVQTLGVRYLYNIVSRRWERWDEPELLLKFVEASLR